MDSPHPQFGPNDPPTSSVNPTNSIPSDPLFFSPPVLRTIPQESALPNIQSPFFGQSYTPEANLTPPTVMPMKLAPPPEFTSSPYNTWREDFLFWRELYSFVGDQQVYAVLGLHANAALKRIMINFTKSTRGDLSRRTLKGLLRLLDESFEASSQERKWKRSIDLCRSREK